MPLAPHRWMALSPPATNVGLNLSVGGYDRTGVLADGSLSVNVGVHGNSLGTMNGTFNDPTVVPAPEDIVRVFADSSELFEGRVKDVEHSEFKGGHRFVKIGAQDMGPDPTLPSGAPWGLSDTPDGTTTHGYESMRKTIRTTEGGASRTTITVVLAESGLWANMLVSLTSAVHGLSANDYLARDARLSWRNAKSPPRYTLECGDAIVSLAQLVRNVTFPDGGISTTEISDQAITTPKLHTNAVISKVANIANTVLINEDGVRITGGALTVVNPSGTVIIDGSSDMFRVAASGTVNLTGCNALVAYCLATTNLTIATGLTYAPAHDVYISSSGVFATMLPAAIVIEYPAVGDAASVNDWNKTKTEVVSGNQTKITFDWLTYNVDRSATTYTHRYYILQLVAL